MIKCNKDNMLIFLPELRSGKYKQTKGHLADESGYCCLGVACEVSIANGVQLRKTLTDAYGGAIFDFRSGHYDVSAYSLPDVVMEWLGVPDYDLKVVVTPEEFEVLRVAILNEHGTNLSEDLVWASELNDQQWSFSRIADAIEAAYLKD